MVVQAKMLRSPATSLAALLAALACRTAAQQALSCATWPAAAKYCGQPLSGFERGVGYPKAKTTAGPSTTSER
eukprot:SAG31_NODE_3060_length_4732_cov_2.919706_1_plen_73_part_00